MEEDLGEPFVEFDAILLALDDRECLHPLTETLAVQTLPLGNLPLIAFPLYQIAQAGFESAIIVASQSSHAAISTCLRNLMDTLSLQLRLEIVPNGIGSADALRRIRSMIHRDFVLFDSDIMCKMPLLELADLHRRHLAGATVLLNHMETPNGETFKQKRKQLTADITRHYVAIGNDDVLMYLRSAVDVETESTFSFSHKLMRRGEVTIQTRIQTTGIAILSHWLLDLLDAKKAISSVYGELIPYLTEKQFVEPFPWKELVGDQTAARLARQMSNNYEKGMSPMNGCYAMIIPRDYHCTRINSIPSYMAAQMMLAVSKPESWAIVQESNRVGELTRDLPPTSKVFKSLVASGVTIGEGVVLRECVIGVGCTIGANTLISRSVLMDNINISSNCRIDGTIISPQSVIESQCSLSNCIVGAAYTVEPDSECKNETLFNSHD